MFQQSQSPGEAAVGSTPQPGVLGFLAGKRKKKYGCIKEDSHTLETRQLRFRPNCTHSSAWLYSHHTQDPTTTAKGTAINPQMEKTVKRDEQHPGHKR